MLIRFLGAVLLVFGGGMMTGCGWMVAGVDGNIKHSVGSGEWDEVNYAYLSVGSVPEGAVVYLQVTTEIEMNIRAGIDVDETDSDSITSEWITLGSTPVLNHRLAVSGSDVSRRLGSTARSTFTMANVRVRVEKPGYEPEMFEHVAMSSYEVVQPGLVVELVPVGGGAAGGD